jgi:hypothetical protein
VSGTPVHWYDGIAPATAPVVCGGGRHLIVWRRGRVSAPAHDLAAEQALAALGGGSCPCLDLLAACRDTLGVEDLFLLWTEQAEPSVGTSQALERWARRVGRSRSAASGAVGSAWSVGSASGTTAARRAEERRSALLTSLPLAFRRRVALGVFRAIGREAVPDLSTSHPGFEPILGSLLVPALRSAGLGSGGTTDGRVPVRWRPAAAGSSAAVEIRGRTLVVSVSPGWAVDVWAWDLAVVDGWFVLEVLRRRSVDHVAVRAVPPPAERTAAGDVRYASIRRLGGRWRVDDDRAGSSCARSRLASATALPSQSLLK